MHVKADLELHKRVQSEMVLMYTLEIWYKKRGKAIQFIETWFWTFVKGQTCEK